MRLEARHVEVRLAGRAVLEDVSCVAEPGIITAVIGPNGAGKSTLLRALSGIAGVQQGEVLLAGRALVPSSGSAACPGGMVRQAIVQPIGRRSMPPWQQWMSRICRTGPQARFRAASVRGR
jgi:ABC-type cobalamin/Fe3+-siderophores transport system ATPase subunit